MRGIFITGTDTEVGKTVISAALIRRLVATGYVVAPYKPVASGASVVGGQLQNTDAQQLIAASGRLWEYSAVNPYVFAPAIAPHIAAAEQNCTIDSRVLMSGATALAAQSDFLVVEGAGGWKVPLAQDYDMAALASQLQLPVLLVVSLKLGCINHAVLTAEAILSSGNCLLGWVINEATEQCEQRDAIINTLHQLISAPCLAEVPYVNNPVKADRYLDIETILKG